MCVLLRGSSVGGHGRVHRCRRRLKPGLLCWCFVGWHQVLKARAGWVARRHPTRLSSKKRNEALACEWGHRKAGRNDTQGRGRRVTFLEAHRNVFELEEVGESLVVRLISAHCKTKESTANLSQSTSSSKG